MTPAEALQTATTNGGGPSRECRARWEHRFLDISLIWWRIEGSPLSTSGRSVTRAVGDEGRPGRVDRSRDVDAIAGVFQLDHRLWVLAFVSYPAWSCENARPEVESVGTVHLAQALS